MPKSCHQCITIVKNTALQIHHNIKSLKVTTSCHDELHESSLTNTLAGIHVLPQRSLQDASNLHVVWMLHGMLTIPTKSMALLYSSAQHPHQPINKTSPCHINKSTYTSSLSWNSSLDTHKWHLYKCSRMMSLHKTPMFHVSNFMFKTKVSHVFQLSRPITTIVHPHLSLQSSLVNSITQPISSSHEYHPPWLPHWRFHEDFLLASAMRSLPKYHHTQVCALLQSIHESCWELSKFLHMAKAWPIPSQWSLCSSLVTRICTFCHRVTNNPNKSYNNQWSLLLYIGSHHRCPWYNHPSHWQTDFSLLYIWSIYQKLNWNTSSTYFIMRLHVSFVIHESLQTTWS